MEMGGGTSHPLKLQDWASPLDGLVLYPSYLLGQVLHSNMNSESIFSINNVNKY